MKKYLVEYDQQSDAAYIRISGSKIADTLEASSGAFADIDKRRNIVGLEILNFSKRKIKLNELISKQFENLAVVA